MTVTVSSSAYHCCRRAAGNSNFERARTVLSSSGIASDTTHLTSGCATTNRMIIPGFLSLNTADTRTWVSMTTLTGQSEQRRLPLHCQLPCGCGLGAGLVSTSAKCEVLPSERRPVVRLRSSRLQPVAPPRTANRTARLGADLQSPRIWFRHRRGSPWTRQYDVYRLPEGQVIDH